VDETKWHSQKVLPSSAPKIPATDAYVFFGAHGDISAMVASLVDTSFMFGRVLDLRSHAPLVKDKLVKLCKVHGVVGPQYR
jgi:hypothetical protein